MSSMAHSYVEYEEMLRSFRCQDLANLLAFAGQSKNGKKSELLDRCLNILKKGSASIQLKIREIHNRISSSSGSNYTSLMTAVTSSSSSTSNSPDPLFASRYSPNLAQSSGGLPSTGFNGGSQFPYHHNPMNYAMPSLGNGSTNSYHPIGFNAGHHLASSGSASSSRNGLHPAHANFKVNFEKLAFYEFLYEISAPIKMIGSNSSNRTLSYWFNFFLNNEQVNQILETREMISGRLEYSKQIHFRFGMYDNSPQQDNLPPNLILNINGKPAQLPTPKPTSKPNADIVRPGRSIDVTSICKLAPNMANKVELNWTNADPNKIHCVGVYLFRKVSVATLLENLKKNCVKDAEITRKMVRDKLQINDDDFEIETTTYKISLMCPLMKFRMHLPGRSSKCKHVQCFDIESYLMMNEKKPTWNCPVCDQHVPYENLIIDSLYQEILSKATDVEEVQFTADGQWSKIQADKKSSSRSGNKTSNSANNSLNEEKEVVASNIKTVIKMDEDQFVDLIDDTSPEPNTRTAPPIAKTSKQADVIDLTLDSDEEQPPPPPRATNVPKPNPAPSQPNRVIVNDKTARSNSQSSTTSSLSTNTNYLNDININLYDAFTQLLDNNPTHANNNIDNRFDKLNLNSYNNNNNIGGDINNLVDEFLADLDEINQSCILID